jgi:superfamily II DNA or RNA helicase
MHDFGEIFYDIKYSDNPEAVNLCIDLIALPVLPGPRRMPAHFEKEIFLEAVAPRKLVALACMLLQAMLSGQQGLVFFNRRMVQQVYTTALQSDYVYKIHGNPEEHDMNTRQTIKQMIAQYDPTNQDHLPLTIMTTNCWSTGVDMPKLSFTIFVNEVCEGLCHAVQSTGRCLRQTGDKTAVSCFVCSQHTREHALAQSQQHQLEVSYGKDCSRVCKRLPPATNFLLNDTMKAVLLDSSLTTPQACTRLLCEINRQVTNTMSSKARRAYTIAARWLSQWQTDSKCVQFEQDCLAAYDKNTVDNEPTRKKSKPN